MRLVLIMLMCGAAVVAFATPGYMTSLELSRDNGNFDCAWCYNGSGLGAYVGDQYNQPSGGPWYLSGIKYYTPNFWPDYIMQGFGVACWKMVDSIPGTLVWPADGEPVYNPNLNGGWIVQEVSPNFNLSLNCPDGFLVGIEFKYALPACDGVGVDGSGYGPYEWAHPSGGDWDAAPYHKNMIRALINDIGNPGVETTTIGQIRALYR